MSERQNRGYSHIAMQHLTGESNLHATLGLSVSVYNGMPKQRIKLPLAFI